MGIVEALKRLESGINESNSQEGETWSYKIASSINDVGGVPL
jgi:hypothetical protein